MEKQNQTIVVRKLKRSEYYTLALIVMLLFLVFFFLIILGREPGKPILIYALSVSGISSVAMAIILFTASNVLDRRMNQIHTWEIGSKEITFKDSSFSKKEKVIPTDAIKEIKYDQISAGLERGIKVFGQNGVVIFIPQNSDRFYDVQAMLKNLNR